MSVCTSGLIATDFKNPFPMLGLVESTLNQLMRPHWTRRLALQARKDGDTQPPFVRPNFSMTSPGSGSVQLHFTYKGEARMLTLHFMCDCDHRDVHDGYKVLLSLGDSGLSRPLMKALLLPLSIFGEAWLDECDSDDRDHEPVHRDRKVTLMDLFACDLVHMSQVAVQEWYRFWQSTPQLQRMHLSEFIGLTEEEVLRLEAASGNYEDGCRLMEQLLEEYTASMEPLSLDFAAIDACFPDWQMPAEYQDTSD